MQYDAVFPGIVIAVQFDYLRIVRYRFLLRGEALVKLLTYRDTPQAHPCGLFLDFLSRKVPVSQ
jgi:hypothetical protein